MIKYLVRIARTIRRKYIPDDWVGLPVARAVYRWIARVAPIFERKGVPVNIGGYGYFRVHPTIVIGTYNFEEWGSGHNSGFSQWVAACRGKKCVLDIGAHIGLYSLPASHVLSPGGKLYAFEPANTNRRFLTQHIAYNKIRNIEVVPDLVGDEQKQDVEFFETDLVHGMNTIAQESVAHKSSVGQFHKTFKKQIRLDDFCKEKNIVPEVVKIDVEGGELGVFKGGCETFKSAHPLIFLSVHPAHLKHLGSSVEELYEVIRDLGYRAYTTQGQLVNALRKEEYILRP